MTALSSLAGTLTIAAWLLIVATAAIVFRRRIVTILVRVAAPKDDPAAQRRDLTVGVILVAVFAVVLDATVTAASLLPVGGQPWVLGIGLPVAVVVNILYWVRFANAGLSVTGWLRR